MPYQTLCLSIDAQVATLFLNRPDVHNAFDATMIQELRLVLAELAHNTEVRVLVLRGKGRSFSAGADLQWMQAMVDYDYQKNLADAKELADLLSDLYHFKKPTFALVEGPAYGGALGLISCCDMAIATEKARFCLSETRLGLIPAVISPYVINAIGERAARRYYLTAEAFDAAEAYRIGLIHAHTTEAALPALIKEWIARVLQNSPLALCAAKELISATSRGHLNKAMIEDTAHRIASIRVSLEGQEGLRAFLEKRPPQWQAVPPLRSK